MPQFVPILRFCRLGLHAVAVVLALAALVVFIVSTARGIHPPAIGAGYIAVGHIQLFQLPRRPEFRKLTALVPLLSCCELLCARSVVERQTTKKQRRPMVDARSRLLEPVASLHGHSHHRSGARY